eukprot:Colp12_sorted_trinity150504_noHs@987
MSIEVLYTTDPRDSRFDALVVVAESYLYLPESLNFVKTALEDASKYDAAVGKGVVFVIEKHCPGRRLVFAPTGPLDRDYDDVRNFKDAAAKGADRARQAGAKRPLFVIQDDSFRRSTEVSLLSALATLHYPLEYREHNADAAATVAAVGVLAMSEQRGEQIARLVEGLELGRIVARDIGGSDPERMNPLKVAEYVQETFQDSLVKVDVISDLGTLEAEYPLLSAVARASNCVPRHRPCIVELEYVGEGPITHTLMLVGKGVTYDTGGADVKTGGAMQGMHRDKCGAAAVAGFFQTLAVLRPAHLKVVGRLALVRNSIGSDAYVADEIIKSRAGVRVRVGNTDAEGRMAMTDVLARLKELAVDEVNPHLMTIATLTGHAVRAVGPYSIAMDNGPARAGNCSGMLFKAGEEWADPFEISLIRKEDYNFVAPKSKYEDVVQANNVPSTMTARGHQYPAAFMIIASGLDKHGLSSARPLKYSHLDIAGSSLMWPDIPSASPLLALAGAYVL